MLDFYFFYFKQKYILKNWKFSNIQYYNTIAYNHLEGTYAQDTMSLSVH